MEMFCKYRKNIENRLCKYILVHKNIVFVIKTLDITCDKYYNLHDITTIFKDVIDRKRC